jgi:hypothetical protein
MLVSTYITKGQVRSQVEVGKQVIEVSNGNSTSTKMVFNIQYSNMVSEQKKGDVET